MFACCSGRTCLPSFRTYCAGASDRDTRAANRSHEEETQWTQCIVDYFAEAGCGNLTKAEIAKYCGSPVNSNHTICPASSS